MKLLSLVLSLASLISTVAQANGITVTQQPYDRIERSGITGKIVINPSIVGHPVDPQFYGSHLDSYVPPVEKPFFDDLRIGLVRIGGNEYDVFNWKNKRSITKWDGLKSLNGFEDTARILNSYGATGIFQVNLLGYQPELVGSNYVLKKTFDANAAYEMVKHLNGQLKLNIIHFSMGNEFASWHETHSHLNIWPITSGISADEYIDRYIQFAIAIRKAQEEVNGNANSIKIWGPEISTSWTDWNTSNFTSDCQWTDVPGQVACHYGNGQFTNFIPYFLYRLTAAEKNRTLNPKGYKLLDYFAFHYYPAFRTKISDINSIVTDQNGRQNVKKMLESTRIFNDPNFVNTVDFSSYRNAKPNILGRMNKWILDYYPSARLALNEFAVDSNYLTTNYHPIVRPLYLADLFGIATKEGVSYINNYVMNCDSSSPVPWTMVVDGVEKTDKYYMHKLFSNNFVGSVVDAQDNMGDTVNAYATTQGDSVNIAIVNKSPLDRQVQIYLKTNSENKIATYLVPGWSASIMKVDKNLKPGSASFPIYQFGAKEMGIEKDPAYAN